MLDEERAYQEIAKILVGNGPVNAKLLKYSFICLCNGPEPADGAFLHEFDYIDSEGDEKWFDIPDSDATTDLLEFAVEIRRSMFDISGSVWNKMIFSIDMEKKSFKADFVY